MRKVWRQLGCERNMAPRCAVERLMRGMQLRAWFAANVFSLRSPRMTPASYAVRVGQPELKTTSVRAIVQRRRFVTGYRLRALA